MWLRRTPRGRKGALFAGIVLFAAVAAPAAGPHVAKRSHSERSEVVRLGPSMRIGEMSGKRPIRAAAKSKSARARILTGVTPAGGVTVELEGRFMTQVVTYAGAEGAAGQCSAERSTGRP